MWHGPALNKILNVISIILDLYWIWIVALVEFSHYHYDHSTSSFHFYRSSEYLYTWVRLSTIVIIIHTSGITRTTLDALQRDHIEFWFWRSAVRRLSLTAQEGPHVELMNRFHVVWRHFRWWLYDFSSCYRHNLGHLYYVIVLIKCIWFRSGPSMFRISSINDWFSSFTSYERKRRGREGTFRNLPFAPAGSFTIVDFHPKGLFDFETVRS